MQLTTAASLLQNFQMTAKEQEDFRKKQKEIKDKLEDVVKDLRHCGYGCLAKGVWPQAQIVS